MQKLAQLFSKLTTGSEV